MANNDEYCKGKNSPQMITLPEEIIHEIFNSRATSVNNKQNKV